MKLQKLQLRKESLKPLTPAETDQVAGAMGLIDPSFRICTYFGCLPTQACPSLPATCICF